jgi:hypothetical protein
MMHGQKIILKMWKKFGRAGHATYDNIIRRMRFASWITEAVDTHSEYVIHNDLPQLLH